MAGPAYAADPDVAAPPPVPSPPAPRVFGERSELIITADRLVPLVSYTATSVTEPQGSASAHITDTGGSVAFLLGREPSFGVMHTVPRVAVDYSVARRFTIGTAFVFALGIGGSHREERTVPGEPTATRENDADQPTLLGFAPRAGYVLTLSRSRGLHFWPRAGLSFYSMRSERAATTNTGITSTAATTDTLFSLDLDPQIVWTPLSHVLVSGGVLANLPLTGTHETSFEQAADVKERSDDLSVFHFGISLGLGIFFDL